MDWNWVNWLFLAVASGLLAAALFVIGSYLLAITLHRGTCRWPGLVCVARETLWVLLTQSLLLAGWFGSGLRSTPRRNGAAPGGEPEPAARPIILVHGYTQSRTNFVWLVRVLRGRGLGPFYGFNYFSFARIEQSAANLRAFVDRVIDATGAEEVDLVCHSMGGLVARMYVDLMGGDRHVRCVVTLGTPHRGVLHARMGVGPGVLDLDPSTGFIRRLDEAPLPPSVRYHSIYSEHDNVVFPCTFSSIGDRGQDTMVRGHGHFGILFSQEVAEHVYGTLSARTVEQLAAAAPAGLVAQGSSAL